MAISAVTLKGYGETNTGGSTTVATSAGAWTPTANKKTIVKVTTRSAAAMLATPALSGCSLTTKLIARRSATGAAQNALWVFEATGASPTSGELTFTAGGSDTFDAAIIHASEVSSDAATYVTQVVHSQFDTGGAAEQLVAITTQEGNCLIGGAFRVTSTTFTPNTDWSSLRHDVTTGTLVTLDTFYRLSTDTDGGGTFGSTTGGGAVILLEISETAPAIPLVGQVVDTIAAGAGTEDITLPSGLAENDIVVVLLASDDALDNAGGDGGITTSGYTVIQSSGAGVAPGYILAYKRMTATPDTTITVDQLAGTVIAACVQVWRTVDATTAEDAASPTPATGTSASPDSPSITTVTNNARVIAVLLMDDDDAWASPPQGYRDPISMNTGQASTTVGATVAMASFMQPSAGATDPGAFATSGNDAWVANTFALRPVAAAATGGGRGAVRRAGLTPSAVRRVA